MLKLIRAQFCLRLKSLQSKTEDINEHGGEELNDAININHDDEELFDEEDEVGR